jgi:hypothetical protein
MDGKLHDSILYRGIRLHGRIVIHPSSESEARARADRRELNSSFSNQTVTATLISYEA